MAQKLRTTLLGVFELSIFMPSFLDRFSGHKNDALRSFLFPILLYPFIAMTFAYNQEITPDANVMAAHALVTWGGIFLFYGIVHMLARAMRRQDFFWQTINILNCQSILTFALMTPLFLSVFLGEDKLGANNLTHYWVFLLLVGMGYKAFILAHSLRLNLPLGGFLATVNLYISDISYQFLMGLTPHDIV